MLDRNGEQIRTDRNTFEQTFQGSAEVSFQWWFAAEHDVYCRVRVLDGIDCIEFGMEGCSPGELDALGDALRTRCLRRLRELAGMVFDPDGFAEELNWDEFFVREKVLDWSAVGVPFPAVVALPQASLKRFLALPSGLTKEQVDGICFLSRRIHS